MLTSHRFRAVLKAMIAIAVSAALGMHANRFAIAGKPSGGGTTPAYTLTNLGGFTAYGTFLDTQARGITNPDAFGLVHVAGYSRVAGNGSTMPWDAYVWSVSQTGAYLATSDLGTLSPPNDPYARSSYANGINNSGVVVGRIDDGSAFVVFPGTGAGTGMYRLPFSVFEGAYPYVAAAVNNPGADGGFSIVGDVVDANRIDHGLLWQVSGPDSNGYHALSAPVDLGAFVPTAINDSGVMVGHQAGVPAMATLANGVTLLRVFAGDTAGSALGINNLGDVVGWSNPSGGATQAIVWSRGSAWYPVILKRLHNNLGCKAYDINEQGQIVGFSYTNSALHAGVLWENDSVYDLNTLAGAAHGNPSVTWATAINDMGQISGVANVKAGVVDDRAVVLTRKP
jgi:probable HAF family extracellular repeat protein